MTSRETTLERYCAVMRATLDERMEEHPLLAGAASGECTLAERVEGLEGRFEAEMPTWKEALTFSAEARERAGVYIAEVGSLVDAINAASEAVKGWQAEPISKQPGMFGRAFGEKNSLAAGAVLTPVGYSIAAAAIVFAVNPVAFGVLLGLGYMMGYAGSSTLINGLAGRSRRKAIATFFGSARERASQTDTALHFLYAPEVVQRNPEAFAKSYAGMPAGEQEYLRETLREYVHVGALDMGEAQLEKIFAGLKGDETHQEEHTG